MLWGLNHEDYIVFGASVLMFGPVERWGDTCMLNKDKQMKTEVKSKNLQNSQVQRRTQHRELPRHIGNIV